MTKTTKTTENKQPKLVAPEKQRELRAFQMLSDNIRRLILEQLAIRPTNVSDLCAALDETQPSISHHLTLMRDLGLVNYNRDGKTNTYYTVKESLQELQRIIGTLLPK